MAQKSKTTTAMAIQASSHDLAMLYPVEMKSFSNNHLVLWRQVSNSSYRISFHKIDESNLAVFNTIVHEKQLALADNVQSKIPKSLPFASQSETTQFYSECDGQTKPDTGIETCLHDNGILYFATKVVGSDVFELIPKRLRSTGVTRIRTRLFHIQRQSEFDNREENAVKGRSLGQTPGVGVEISNGTPAIADFETAAALAGLKGLDVDAIAQLSAKEIFHFQSVFEQAAKHRARSDFFGVELGEKVTIEQVNKFLRDNAGRILETYQKIQIAKVIQELMKSEGAELWKDAGDWEYRCTISTSGRSDANTRAFFLQTHDKSVKIPNPKTTGVPENIQLKTPNP